MKEVIIDGIRYVPETIESINGKFKAGDWVIGVNGCYPDLPKRIKKVYDDIVMFDDDTKGWIKYFDTGELRIRHYLDDEVERYLIKEAEKRYPVGTVIKSFTDGGKLRTVKPYYKMDTMIWKYIPEGDRLYCNGGMDIRGGLCSNPDIYKDGVWAEVVTAKELPKTVDELEKVIREWSEISLISLHLNYLEEEIKSFLSNYR